MEGTSAVVKKRMGVFGISTLNNSPMRSTQMSLKSPRKQVVQSKQEVIETSRVPGRQLHKVKNKDNCWICEGWNECKFDIRSRIAGAEVNLHFDFDDYRPDLMM